MRRGARNASAIETQNTASASIGNSAGCARYPVIAAKKPPRRVESSSKPVEFHS